MLRGQETGFLTGSFPVLSSVGSERFTAPPGLMWYQFTEGTVKFVAQFLNGFQ